MATVDELYSEAEKLKDAGDYQSAIDKLQELLQQDERYSLAHLALAVIYGKVGDHESAVRHGQRACELEPNDPCSHTAMSVTYQRAFAGTQDRTFIHLAEESMARAHAIQASR